MVKMTSKFDYCIFEFYVNKFQHSTSIGEISCNRSENTKVVVVSFCLDWWFSLVHDKERQTQTTSKCSKILNHSPKFILRFNFVYLLLPVNCFYYFTSS